MTIDLGFGDGITPAPLSAVCPPLPGQPAPHRMAYDRPSPSADQLKVTVALEPTALHTDRFEAPVDLVAGAGAAAGAVFPR